MNKRALGNLPVKSREKSTAFFGELGYTFNPQFSTDKGACMVIDDGSIYAMLLTEPFFKTLIDKPVVQAKEATEVLVTTCGNWSGWRPVRISYLRKRGNDTCAAGRPGAAVQCLMFNVNVQRSTWPH